MLTLSRKDLGEKERWAQSDIGLPEFDVAEMAAHTAKSPKWVHFGAGNIFRGFIAMLQQSLLNEKQVDAGIVAVETYDYEIIDRIYRPYDDLGLCVVMYPDGRLKKTVVGSIGESLAADCARPDWARLQTIFTDPGLQMISFTITEKGYNLRAMSGEFMPVVQKDIANGPAAPEHVMAKVASLLYTRYRAGAWPLAVVSMDNCSHNGEKLRASVVAIVSQWADKGLVEPAFVDYVQSGGKVSFPWSMIDKITPRPSDSVKKALEESGFGSTEVVVTAKHTYIAPFVNTEGPQYLVIEDDFPNGRPPLEKAGVFFTDRETVEKVERMKVCTCLNPLHTSMSIFGCLLGYTLIADEMKDPLIHKLVEKVGYDEGMPVVTDPGIFKPMDFIGEVIGMRLPNPSIPDTPQRIMTDTSQKVGIRFGETIRAYAADPKLDVKSLTFIPLVIAGWCRYLMGMDDEGKKMTLSADPLLDTLTGYLAGVKLTQPADVHAALSPILSNVEVFGSDLYQAGLGEKIEGYFAELIQGPGAVRATLAKYLG